METLPLRMAEVIDTVDELTTTVAVGAVNAIGACPDFQGVFAVFAKTFITIAGEIVAAAGAMIVPRHHRPPAGRSLTSP